MSYDNVRNMAEWLDGGERAIMLVTSALHHAEPDGDYCEETGSLLAGMLPWEMALTLTWLARLAGETLLAKAGDRESALEEIRRVALQLQEARSTPAEVDPA